MSVLLAGKAHAEFLADPSFASVEDIMAGPDYTAVIRQDGPWWIGWIEEVRGVNSQGTTRQELIANLREALGEALELNRAEARKAAGASFEEVVIHP